MQDLEVHVFAIHMVVFLYSGQHVARVPTWGFSILTRIRSSTFHPDVVLARRCAASCVTVWTQDAVLPESAVGGGPLLRDFSP